MIEKKSKTGSSEKNITHQGSFSHISFSCFFSPAPIGDSSRPEPTVVAAPHQILPSGYWWSLLYATALGLVCLLVCLIGAHIYAKATFLIFLVVMFVLGTVFVSFFAVSPRVITLPINNNVGPNGSGLALAATANFTGFKLETLLGNLMGEEHATETAENRPTELFFFFF